MYFFYGWLISFLRKGIQVSIPEYRPNILMFFVPLEVLRFKESSFLVISWIYLYVIVVASCFGIQEKIAAFFSNGIFLLDSRCSILNWTGNKRKVPLIHFSVANVLVGAPRNELESIREFTIKYLY